MQDRGFTVRGDDAICVAPALVIGNGRSLRIRSEDHANLLIAASLQLCRGSQHCKKALIIGLAEQIDLHRVVDRLGVRSSKLGSPALAFALVLAFTSVIVTYTWEN